MAATAVVDPVRTVQALQSMLQYFDTSATQVESHHWLQQYGSWAHTGAVHESHVELRGGPWVQKLCWHAEEKQ